MKADKVELINWINSMIIIEKFNLKEGEEVAPGATMVKYMENDDSKTQLFIAKKENDLYLAFEASKRDDIPVDANIVPVCITDDEETNLCHQGFRDAFRSVEDGIKEYLAANWRIFWSSFLKLSALAVRISPTLLLSLRAKSNFS